ncbi:Eukaryotic aspartyl protease family protein [Raphanus sativus]|nr:Eukaryotic aspartyl protease family protein [Raphanus sativus]
MSFATRLMSMVLSLQIIAAFLFITAAASSPPSGFTMDLIHRRTNSSSSRHSNPDDLRSSPRADVFFDTSEYLMKLQIGTPPVEIEAVLDTGSEVIWTQCVPCLNCYYQRNIIFDPSKSSTYKERICNTSDHTCDYTLLYGDQSYSEGIFATETITLQSTSGHSYVMPKTLIGCSHNSSGFGATTASGIVGLSLGSLSLISQMGKDMLGAFSYCFSPERTSKISFGSNAIVSGEGTVSTPMFMKKEKPGFYYLNLDAVSVGETRVETLGTPFHAVDGNIVIDSGTTLTYLPASYCSLVRESVEKVVTSAERVTFPDLDTLCYKTNTMDIFPVITMHFSVGADLVLDKNNTYKAMDNGEAICLMILCSPMTPVAEEAVFGNRAQNNFLVSYDRSSLQVSFKPTDCGVTEDKPRDSTSAASFLQFNIKFVLFLVVLSLIRL